MQAFICATPLTLRSSLSHHALTPLRTHTPLRAHTPALARRAPRAHLDTGLALATNPAWLTSLADAFGTLGMPKWLVTYGHPAMMAFMVVGMGGGGAAAGWAGRLNGDKREGVKQKALHENIMVAFWMLAFLGGSGGVLSTAMQGYDIFESPHAASAALVLTMLSAVGVYAYSGFSLGNDGSPKAKMKGRTIHAWLGAATMGVFLIHGALGVNILLQG